MSRLHRQSHVTKSDDATPVEKAASGPRAKMTLSDHERKMIDDLSVITRAANPEYGVVSARHQYE